MNCLHCQNHLTKDQKKFCNQQCQASYTRLCLVEQWLAGKHSGMRGKTSTVGWIKWFLIELYGEQCLDCNWAVKNPHTGNIPIELNHIDGNFMNNQFENLELLCPNCHALTSTYKGANTNKGRPRSKYYRGL
jgi:hypothetical protein